MVPIYKSRKFWLAVYGVAQTLVLHYFQVPADIIAAVDALIVVLISAIAYEDAANATAGRYDGPI